MNSPRRCSLRWLLSGCINQRKTAADDDNGPKNTANAYHDSHPHNIGKTEIAVTRSLSIAGFASDFRDETQPFRGVKKKTTSWVLAVS
jgi:hypothetical protein